MYNIVLYCTYSAYIHTYNTYLFDSLVPLLLLRAYTCGIFHANAHVNGAEVWYLTVLTTDHYFRIRLQPPQIVPNTSRLKTCTFCSHVRGDDTGPNSMHRENMQKYLMVNCNSGAIAYQLLLPSIL